MTGPTWRFWTWTADDWPYGLAMVIFGSIAVYCFVRVGLSLAGIMP